MTQMLNEESFMQDCLHCDNLDKKYMIASGKWFVCCKKSHKDMEPYNAKFILCPDSFIETCNLYTERMIYSLNDEKQEQ
jgi:hypothetical protein